MEDYYCYRLINRSPINDDRVISSSNIIDSAQLHDGSSSEFDDYNNMIRPRFDLEAAVLMEPELEPKMSHDDLILKTHIANHPAFPQLLAASIQSHKVYNT